MNSRIRQLIMIKQTRQFKMPRPIKELHSLAYLRGEKEIELTTRKHYRALFDYGDDE